MKTKCSFILAVAFSTIQALGQGTIVVNPVPVTNGVTGTLADSSIVAALYYGPQGAPEDSLLMLGPASALVNGFAQFGSQTAIPVFAPGTPLQVGVRAWSSGYPSYEAAIASSLPSVLAGKSLLSTVTIGGFPSPPPVPGALDLPGFTVYPVPEPATPGLILIGFAALTLWRRKSNRASNLAPRHWRI
jgi:hypothetical protein